MLLHLQRKQIFLRKESQAVVDFGDAHNQGAAQSRAQPPWGHTGSSPLLELFRIWGPEEYFHAISE